MNQEMIEKLKVLAARDVWSDLDPEDLNPYELSGGNFDDAYYAGQKSGETDIARIILHSMGIKW